MELRMDADAERGPGSRLERWSEPALTMLAVELALAVFIVAPLGVTAPRDGFVLPFVITALVVVPVLLTGLLVASRNGAATAAVFVAAALIVAGMVFAFLGPSELATSLHLAGALIMGCALIWVVARAVFAPGRVTLHRLVGTVVLYLMIGATFAGLYGTLALVVPHAFRGTPPRTDGAALIAHALYFSFQTLTTAGYGDITPTHPLTRGLSNLESVIGQLYPATLIARVVTLELAGRGRGDRSGDGR
jgi:hypothetical protein